MNTRLLASAVLSAAVVLSTAAAARADLSPAATVTLSVGGPTGTSLPADVVGFSFEANVLTGTAPSAGNLAQYMKTLGPGVMRFGGNFVDTTFWTSTGEPQPSWAVATLTPADLTRLNTLATNSGWKVVLGVTLKHPDAKRAADEAAHAKAALGDSLLAIEVGNEPNYYPNYSTAKYFADFESYRKAINAAAPGVGLVGPSPGRIPAADVYLKDFAADEQKSTVDIAALTGHYYPLCAKSNNPPPTIANLLSTTSRTGEKTRADLVSSLAKGLGVPGFLGEGNSVSCEGKDGVSDVFAAALWGVDAQLLYAQEGLSGFWMHSSIARCGAPKPLYKAYTPFCAATDADAAAGVLHVRPVYYSSLLVHSLGTGDFAQVSDSDLATVRAYALRSGTTLKLVLVNVSTSSRPTTVHLGQSFGSASMVRLTAPSLTSQSGITFGGHFVGRNGTFSGTAAQDVPLNGKDLTMTLPSASATVVTVVP